MEEKHEHGGCDRPLRNTHAEALGSTPGRERSNKCHLESPAQLCAPQHSAPVQQEFSTARGPQNRSQKPNGQRTRLRDADLANSRAGTTRRQDTCIVGIAVLKANAVHALAFVPFR
jgi:hypothetical protein